jgi:hypothetical protein
MKLLNNDDKKLINSDPYYFLKDNKYLYKLTKIQFKTLLYRLKEEEELEEKKKKENDIKNSIIDFNDSIASESNNEIKQNSNNETKKITIKK